MAPDANSAAPGASDAQPYSDALLRAGFPYVKTIGMRRVTWYPIDIALGAEGRVYCLARFDVSGTIRVINWDDDDLGGIGGGWTWPVAIVPDAEERLYITDEAAHTVTVLARDGEQLAQWGEHGSEPGQLNRPAHMAFDGEGQLWIADTLNHRVQSFTTAGEYISGFGRHGNGHGELDLPWGIALDAEGCIYVGDWRNDRVQKFSPQGEFLIAIGSSGDGDGELNRPAGVAVDAHGDIYVADRGNHRVQLFDRSGRYVEQFMGDSTLSRMGLTYIRANAKVLRLREMARLEPQKRFRAPASVRLGSDGHMYVADYGCHRVQIYRKEAYPLSEDQVMPAPGAPSLSTV